MTEMMTTVQHVAQSVASAADTAGDVERDSRSGQQVIDESVGLINALVGDMERGTAVINKMEENSQQVTAVLDVIRGVAEQTNLLALNAAIEAARAGEQGRGFAVVADEVRKLAHQAQQATQQIQAMLEQFVSGTREAVRVMESGSQQAQDSAAQIARAGTALTSINQGMAAMHELNNRIAAAIKQQTAVAEHIDSNMGNINEIAGNNAAIAARLIAENQRIQALSEALSSDMAAFKLS